MNEATAVLEKERQNKLDQLLGRIAKLTGGTGNPAAAVVAPTAKLRRRVRGQRTRRQPERQDGIFIPLEPATVPRRQADAKARSRSWRSSSCCRAATPAAATSPNR